MKDAASNEPLIESCLAGEMTAEAERAFMDRLETDAELRREFVRQAGVDRLLREALRPEGEHLEEFRRATVALAQGLSDEQFRQKVMKRIAVSAGSKPEAVGRGRRSWRVLPAWSSREWMKVAAGLLLVAGVAFLVMKTGVPKATQNVARVVSPVVPGEPPKVVNAVAPIEIASIENFYGDSVKIAGAEGAWQPVSAGQRLVSGSRIQTGKSGRCRVRFLDDTMVDVNGDALVGVLVRDGQKVCQATGGDCRYVVSHQPAGRPLIIEGRDAVITVKGTVFTVMDKGQSTLIRVNEGEISVRDPTGSNAVPLVAGQMMAAIRGQPLVAKTGDRNKAEYLKNKGIRLRDSGRLQEAEQELREAIVWHPEPVNGSAFLYLHLAQYERGDLDGCIATIEEAQRRVVSDFGRAYAEIMLHLCELRLGRTTDRLAKYRNGYVGDSWPAPVMDMFLGTISPEAMLAKARGDGEKSSAWYYLGEWYLHKGDTVQARRYFEESYRMKTGWTEPTTAGHRLKQLDLRP